VGVFVVIVEFSFVPGRGLGKYNNNVFHSLLLGYAMTVVAPHVS
jgi:hypothetical protein